MKMFNRIAIMGVGSLGTILGAYIARSGRQVDLIDTNKEHVDALNNEGAKVTGFREITQKVNALTPDEMQGDYDLFIYMAKQTYNDKAIPTMLAHSHEKTCVCTCQNGIPEPELVEHFGLERVFGSPVGWGAAWIGPGVSRLTTDIDQISSSLGAMAPGKEQELAELKEILEVFCQVEVSDNLMGLRWTKLLMNATFSGMSTVCGCTFGDVLASPGGFEKLMQIGKECIDVSRASGIRMEPLHGFDFDQRLDYWDKESKEKARQAYQFYWAPHLETRASMLQDLEKNRKSEIDYINGYVCKAGREANIATPVNDRVVEVVKRIEAGESAIGMHNLEYLMEGENE